MMITRSQQSLFDINGGNGGHCSWKQWSMAATVMVVFINGGRCLQRRQWDEGTMTQWHPWQWHLWLMVVAASTAVVVVNCAVAGDAVATIPSLMSMAAAKTPLPLVPSTTASINNECHFHHQ
jgi:hypothetical protein